MRCSLSPTCRLNGSGAASARFTHGRSPNVLMMPMFVKDEDGEPTDKANAPTPEEANDELAQPADEGEPVEDSHGIPATPEAASGDPTNPTKPRRKSRRPAPPVS